jgi:rhamnosyl/mannosyltransferase
MKLLLVAEAYHPRIGGGVRYECDVVRYFRSLGHTVDVLTVGSSRRMLIKQEIGGKVIYLPLTFLFENASISWIFPIYLWKIIEDYDIVHFNVPSPISEFSSLLLSRGSHKPRMVCTVHGEVVEAKRFHWLYNKWLAPRHLAKVDLILVSNPNFLRTSPLLRRFEAKTRIIPFGVDLAKFSPKWTQCCSSTDEELQLIFVGRLGRYKGVDYLLQAMQRAPGRLRIVGDGPLLNSLKLLAIELGIGDRVTFLGHISDEQLIEAYRSSDITILPSIDRGESFGYVLIEGMACGTAAISTELGTGTSYVNKHGVTGLVVPPRDSDALAKAISYLNEDRAKLCEFKKNARFRVEKLFDVRLMLRKTAEAYASLGTP